MSSMPAATEATTRSHDRCGSPIRRFLLGIATSAAIALQPAIAGTPSSAQLDAEVARAMAATHAKGLAMAVIEDGKVAYARSFGVRNAAGDPLQTDTIMYGASLTKAIFAYTVMQLVDKGVLDLDRPIADYLDRPLPSYPDDDRYAPWHGLAGDPRWKQITARMLLTHSAGFANFAFLEPDGKLRIHFTPGSHYAYSGEGIILLQFVLERGLGLDVGDEMQHRVFDRFGMRHTSMSWRPQFAANLADGWDSDGQVHPHDRRGKVRAAGSMDTTIADMARLAAGYVRGEGLTPKSFAALRARQLPITTASEFPSLQPSVPAAQRRADLAAGLGVVVFDGAQGHGFIKGGHNDTTGNTFVCVQRRHRCVVILSNDVRAESAFPQLVQFALGAIGAPWRWAYGDMRFWSDRGTTTPFVPK
jgi:CubicO group peptidase (beta-lactamase class C family)